MKPILLILALLILAGCENAVEIKGTQKAETVFYNYYKEQALQKSPKNGKEERTLITVQWDSYSLNSQIFDFAHKTIDGQNIGDPLLSLDVGYSSNNLCKSEYVYCKEEEYPSPELRKNKSSLPLKIGSKFTLVGKVIKGSDGFELVEILSLSTQEKTEKENICKRGKFRKDEFKVGDEVFLTSESSFVSKKKNSDSFEPVYGSKFNVDYNRKYKIQEITEGDYKPGTESYGTLRFLKIRSDLWVNPESNVLLAQVLDCDLIDLVGIQETRVQLKKGSELDFNGTKITTNHQDFKNGIKCIKQRIGIVECGWASGYNHPVKLSYDDNNRYFFSDIDFINNFELYAEDKEGFAIETDTASYEIKSQKLMKDGKFKEAIIVLDKACKLKSAESCYNAGVLLTQTLKLQEEGMKYYFKACNLKVPEACNNIAGIQLKGDIHSRFDALTNFEKACSLGLEQSCITKARLKKLFIEKKANMDYEEIFEILFPEIIQELKEKGQYRGVRSGLKV